MNVIILVVLVFFVLAGGVGGVAYVTYKHKLRRAKAIERGLKMVPILIHLPPPSSDTAAGSRDLREVMREKTAQAEVLYNLLAGTATAGVKAKLYGQRQIGLELVATGGVVHFYAAVPVPLVSVVKQAILTAYPGARLEESEDHNIFNRDGRLAATMGGEMVLRTEGAYPIATYKTLERDPLEAILTTLSSLQKDDGVALQIMLRPADPRWVKRSITVAEGKRKGRGTSLGFTPQDLLAAALKAPATRREEEKATGTPLASNLELGAVEQIEEKTKHPGFDTLIRVVVSTDSVARSQQQLRDLATAFALFDAPGLNGFKFLPALDVQGLVTAFIFRFFPPELKGGVLASEELATLFHLPDSQFTPSAAVERMQSKQVDGPIQLSPVGLLFGYNEFRGVQKEIRLSPEDRRRHTYILGQTGTGKSTMLENLAVQDMLAGNGFAFIDPHGDSAEKLLALVPKERAEDVIYFNPADLEYPVGLNLFEFSDPGQKDFIVQETINMLYKLYDPGHTGIIGPRYEHWYRNAALTLMSDPNGSTFIEIPKVFTDTEYLKQKFRYLRDPTVIDFWTKEMGQTSDYHKSEMLGWFVSKFGAFQNNEMMRNIIGQTKSAFNLRDVMDHRRILIVNLSKGRIGELNSQLLGMIFVIKFQAAAMSRAEVPEDQRPDFSLYVDEFQNFSTDSFASILSEARKYRLNLIVANQFIGQLRPEVRDAVFGNIGTIVAHRMGPEDAEFMVKQFAPVFDAGDLVNIPNFNAAMRLMMGGLPSQPFTIRDSPPLGNANLELGVAIKQLSAAKFGRAKAQVERDIFARLSGGPIAPPAAPVVSPAPVIEPVTGAPRPINAGTPGMAGALDVPVTPAPIPSASAGGAAAIPLTAPVAQPQPPVTPAPPAPVPASTVPVVPVTPPATPPPYPAPQPLPLSAAAPPAQVLPPVPPPARSAGTLSLTDITGGKPPQRAVAPAPVLMPDAPAQPNLPAEPEPSMPAPAGPVAPAPELIPEPSIPAPEPAPVVQAEPAVASPEPPSVPPAPMAQPPELPAAVAGPAAANEELVQMLDQPVESPAPVEQTPKESPAPLAGSTGSMPSIDGLPAGVTFIDRSGQQTVVPAPPEVRPSEPEPVVAVVEPAVQPLKAEPQPAQQDQPRVKDDDLRAVMAERIDKLEKQIDDLVGTSLLGANQHRRLPEPAATPKPAGDSQAEPEAPSHKQAAAEESPAHYGLKVIEPVKPIVSRKEELEREVAAMEQAEQTQANHPAPIPPAPLPPPPPPAPEPQARIPEKTAPKAEAPVSPPPPPSPPLPPVPEPAIVKHAGQMMGVPPALPRPAEPGAAVETAAGTTSESGDLMPEPQSLAADDVARARAEREAAQKLGEPAAVPPAPAASAPQGAPEAPQPRRESDQNRQGNNGHKNGKHKRWRDNDHSRDRGPEQPQKQSKPADSPPPTAEDQQSVLTGKLILPSANSKPAEFEEQQLEKPKKLAPGEVFVDEKGNVLIGD